MATASLPGPARLLVLPGRVPCVAEVGEHRCLTVAVAELPEHRERTLVARHSRDMVAGLVLDVAQVVPDPRLIEAMATFPQQGQGPLAELPGLPVAAEVGMAPADSGEGPGLLHLVTNGLEQDQGLLAVAERLGVALLEIGYPGHSPVDDGLPGLVAEPTVLFEAVRQVSMGQVVPGKLRVRPRKDAVSGGLAPDLTEARRRIQPVARDAGQLMPVAAGIQVVPDGQGKLPGVALEPGPGGQGGGGEQDVMFGLEPGQGLPLGHKVLAGDARLRRGDAQRRMRRIDQHGGGVSGVQVVVQRPADGRPPGGIAVEGAGLLGGVGAQQVMEGVTAGGVLGDQVRAGKFGQQVARLRRLARRPGWRRPAP